MAGDQAEPTGQATALRERRSKDVRPIRCFAYGGASGVRGERAQESRCRAKIRSLSKGARGVGNALRVFVLVGRSWDCNPTHLVDYWRGILEFSHRVCAPQCIKSLVPRSICRLVCILCYNTYYQILPQRLHLQSNDLLPDACLMCSSQMTIVLSSTYCVQRSGDGEKVGRPR